MVDDARDREWRRTIDGIWQTLERLAETIDARDAGRTQAPAPRGMTPTALASELGHSDKGVRVCRFLRSPDDGEGAFAHRRYAHWNLDEAEADRVRRRFAPSR